MALDRVRVLLVAQNDHGIDEGGRVTLYRGLFGQAKGDERICFLPLCHVAERVVGVYTALITGTKLYVTTALDLCNQERK